MATKTNPLFSRGEHRTFRKTLRHRARGAARKGLSRLFGIPLSRGLGGSTRPQSGRRKQTARSAHRSQKPPGDYASTVRGDVISALVGQGYKKSQAEKMTPASHSGDNFESLFRRALAKNPGELIIFGNPAHVYSRQGIGRAVKAGNPIPAAIVEGLGIGVGYNLADRALRQNPIPAAILQGIQWTAGSKAAEAALSRKRKRNAACGHSFCFHGAFTEKRDAVAKEKERPGSFIRNLRFGPGDFRWTVLSPIAKNPEERLRLVDAIRHGDRVTIVTPHGQKRTGRAVMRSSVGGWVLNMGGPHGTPGLADDDNVVKVSKRRGNKSHRNPNSIGKAEKLFETFHHRGSSGVYDTQRSAKQRKDFTILGPLVAIGVNAEHYDRLKSIESRKDWENYKVEHWDRLPHLAFLTGSQVSQVKRILDEPEKLYAKDCPQLASSPNGRQLYAITPDGVDLDLRQFDTDTSKDFIDLGEATFVVYIAKKPDHAVEWVHELGEEGGARPRLVLNRLGKKELFFVGGSYRVEGPGILN